MASMHLVIEHPKVIFEVFRRQGVSRLENATSHDIEERVGEVVGRSECVSGDLPAVCTSDYRREFSRAILDVGK